MPTYMNGELVNDSITAYNPFDCGYEKNNNGFKDSCDCYRNIMIKGVKTKFIQWTQNPDEFENEKQYAKNKGLKTRIINGELFIENHKIR